MSTTTHAENFNVLNLRGVDVSRILKADTTVGPESLYQAATQLQNLTIDYDMFELETGIAAQPDIEVFQENRKALATFTPGSEAYAILLPAIASLRARHQAFIESDRRTIVENNTWD